MYDWLQARTCDARVNNILLLYHVLELWQAVFRFFIQKSLPGQGAKKPAHPGWMRRLDRESFCMDYLQYFSTYGRIASAQIWYPFAVGWRKSPMMSRSRTPVGVRNFGPRSS